jgi:hypothetical protein
MSLFALRLGPRNFVRDWFDRSGAVRRSSAAFSELAVTAELGSARRSQAYCECFGDLVDKGRAHAARLAQQAKVDHERKLVQEAQGALYERQMRWNDYIRTADVPHWPEMLDGDADIIVDVVQYDERRHGPIHRCGLRH